MESEQDAVSGCGRDNEPGAVKNQTVVDGGTVSDLPIVPQGCRNHLPVCGKPGDECVAELAVSVILWLRLHDLLNDWVTETSSALTLT